MKKLLMATAVIACAGIVMAATSQNIVGYSKKSLSSGQFLMVSPQFLADVPGGMPLGDAFSGLNDQSVLFTWNGSSYTTYTYFAGFGWFDEFFASADGVLIDQGEAVWLKDSVGGAEALMLGEVAQDASITNNLVVGFNMIANPYPTALSLGDIPSASLSDQDVIFVWNGSSYATYTYFAGFGWFDEFFASADAVQIPVGDGFWLDSAAGGSLILNKPF